MGSESATAVLDFVAPKIPDKLNKHTQALVPLSPPALSFALLLPLLHWSTHAHSLGVVPSKAAVQRHSSSMHKSDVPLWCHALGTCTCMQLNRRR